jgi:type II secretory pathway pseudopilin PulG
LSLVEVSPYRIDECRLNMNDLAQVGDCEHGPKRPVKTAKAARRLRVAPKVCASGFTVVEFLIAFAVLLTIAAIAIPNFLGDTLKTVGFKVSREQGIALARVLLAVTQDWDEVDITAYRLEKRAVDGTYHITVTSFRKEQQRKGVADNN